MGSRRPAGESRDLEPLQGPETLSQWPGILFPLQQKGGLDDIIFKVFLTLIFNHIGGWRMGTHRALRVVQLDAEETV